MKLSIERMAYGAHGIARDSDGRVVMVQGAVPGDIVRARVLKTHKHYLEATTEEVLEASPHRVEQLCEYDSVCGGCPWSRMARRAQLEAKRSCVVDALERIAHLSPERTEELVQPTLAASPDWGYRNKIELACTQAQGKLQLGIHTQDSSQVVPIHHCPLLSHKSSKLIRSLSGALSFALGSQDAHIFRVGIRSSKRTKDTEIALWTPPESFPRKMCAKVVSDALHPSSLVRVLSKGPHKARRVQRVERLMGAGSWSERVGSNRMRFSAPSFFQVNTHGAELLIKTMQDMLEPAKDDVCWDLYSGAGTFTLPLAQATQWVEAIEAAHVAVSDLRRNVSSCDIDNVGIYGGDVAFELPDVSPDIIVVDPPRSGLGKTVCDSLNQTAARSICYISCDPATLARDLSYLEARGTWHATSVQPIDQFAQSFHIETATLLQRRA